MLKLFLGIFGGIFTIISILVSIFVPVSFLKPNSTFFDFVLTLFFAYFTYLCIRVLKTTDRTKPFPGMIFHYDSQKYYFKKSFFQIIQAALARYIYIIQSSKFYRSMSSFLIFLSFWVMWSLISYFIIQVYSESRINIADRNFFYEIIGSIGFGLLVNSILFVLY